MANHAWRWTAVLLLVGVLSGCGGTSVRSTGGPGTEFTFRATARTEARLTRTDLENAAEIMRDRLAKLGVTGNVRLRGSSEVVVRIDGLRSRSTHPVVAANGELDLYDLTPALVPPSVDAAGNSAQPYTNLFDLLSASPSKTTGKASGYALFRPARKSATVYVLARDAGDNGQAPVLHGDSTTGVTGLLDSHGGKVPAGWKVLKIPPKTVVVTCDSTSASICPAENQGALPSSGGVFYYLFKHGAYPGDRYATDGRYPNMTGNDLKLSKIRQDFDQNGQPVILISFTDHGNQAFEQVTQNEARRGLIVGVGASCADTCGFAIVLDNEIRSYPTIDPSQNPQGIDPTATGAQITFGNQSNAVSEAKQLAVVLQTGALPVQFVLVSERPVG
jgi:preprotein translocase subunit SecD